MRAVIIGESGGRRIVDTFQYELMRPQDIVAARARAPIAYVPIGPLEWHGPHLPVGMDMLHAHTMALESARMTGGVVLPPFPMGTETYTEPDRLRMRGFKGDERVCGMDYPGFILPSLYIEESAMGVLIHEVVRGLKRQQFRVIALVNGHGAPNHRGTLTRIAAEESEPGKVAVVMVGYPHETGYREHAAIRETSYLMAFQPDTVDLRALPPLPTPLRYVDFGILDQASIVGPPSSGFAVCAEEDPRHATSDRGRRDINSEAQAIATKVRQLLATVT